MCVIDRASLSLTICGSMKKLTGISTDWPGSSTCSVKQKHCELVEEGGGLLGQHIEGGQCP